MKNHGRLYTLTSGAIVLASLVLIVIIFVLWYMYGYDYVLAPKAVTFIEQAIT